MCGLATFRIDMTEEKDKMNEFMARNDIVIMDVVYYNEYLHNVAYVYYKRSKTNKQGK